MKELDSVQVAQLKRIAEQLLEARQQKSITLDAVATATYIPQRLLQALESEQFERLPEPVYVQGFIRRYADYLGLDGKALSQTFELNPIAASPSLVEPPAPPVVASFSAPVHTEPTRRTPNTPAANFPASERVSEPPTLPKPSTPNIVEPATPPLKSVREDATSVPAPAASVAQPVPSRPEVTRSIQPSPTPMMATTSQRLPEGNASSTTTSSKRPVLPLALAGGAIALLVIGTIAILNQPKSTDRSTASNSAVSDPATNVAPSPVPSTGTSTASSPAPGATNAPVQVAVNLTDRAWLEVVVDGKVEVEDVKEKGFQKTWTAERELYIRSGNAGAVLVSFNQAEAKPMGKVGQVEEVTYTPDSAAKPTSASISQSATEPAATQLPSSSPN
ncbi:MAG TPA: RodZ domain-containing protein [Microcoleaceae cyanobacterium]|jgi:cytoskeletal protein RodZ